MKSLWILFSSSFYLSAFTFGGGYIIIPLLKNRYVEQLKWIEEKEMMDLVSIAQSAPGSIAVNATILIGYKISGIVGAMISTFGTMLPPLILLSIVSYFYTFIKQNIYINAVLLAMSAGVAAIVVDVVYKMIRDLIKKKDIKLVLIYVIILSLILLFNLNLVYIVISTIVYGIMITLKEGSK